MKTPVTSPGSVPDSSPIFGISSGDRWLSRGAKRSRHRRSVNFPGSELEDLSKSGIWKFRDSPIGARHVKSEESVKGGKVTREILTSVVSKVW